MNFDVFGAIAASAVVVGIVWYVWAGTLWQFVPIGLAIAAVRYSLKQAAEDDKGPPKPKKGKK